MKLKFQPRKRFGQHFLRDETIIDRMMALIAPQSSQCFVEIGPGLGVLTQVLLPLVKHLDVIELDRDLIPQLKILCENLGDITIYQADALKFDFNVLVKTNEKLRAVGNLPYNISSQLLFHLLKYAEHIQDMYFMLQKEVVDRLVAQAGQKAYGRLGVMIQYYCEVEKLFDVLPEAFSPRPKVNSAFVKLVPHQTLPYQAKDFNKFAEVVKLAFMQRRKTLRNALKTIITTEQLEKIGIDPKLRPEQITIEQYVKIADGV